MNHEIMTSQLNKTPFFIEYHRKISLRNPVLNLSHFAKKQTNKAECMYVCMHMRDAEKKTKKKEHNKLTVTFCFDIRE